MPWPRSTIRISATDGQWLAFAGSDARLFVAPFRGSQPISPATWLMRQPLDPATKKPAGAATVLHRFGDIMFGDGIINSIAVARDQIILRLTESASDLWSIDLPPR